MFWLIGWCSWFLLLLLWAAPEGMHKKGGEKETTFETRKNKKFGCYMIV
jgi:hypothetical protein